jgi:hypothetical protein
MAAGIDVQAYRKMRPEDRSRHFGKTRLFRPHSLQTPMKAPNERHATPFFVAVGQNRSLQGFKNSVLNIKRHNQQITEIR